MINQKQHKYNAKPVYYNAELNLARHKKTSKQDIYFASSFEFEVYRHLVNLVGTKNVSLQVLICIKPKTYFYPALDWKCDFRIYKPSNPDEYLNIEAKGFVTDEFKLKMQYLEYFSPNEFERLMVIGTTHGIRIDKHIYAWKLQIAVEQLHQMGYRKID